MQFTRWWCIPSASPCRAGALRLSAEPLKHEQAPRHGKRSSAPADAAAHRMLQCPAILSPRTRSLRLPMHQHNSHTPTKPPTTDRNGKKYPRESYPPQLHVATPRRTHTHRNVSTATAVVVEAHYDACQLPPRIILSCASAPSQSRHALEQVLWLCTA